MGDTDFLALAISVISRIIFKLQKMISIDNYVSKPLKLHYQQNIKMAVFGISGISWRIWLKSKLLSSVLP